MKKHLFFLAILLGLGLFAMRTFYGSHYFDGHDALAHIVRLYQYDLALKDGQILPQWAGGLLAGRGYPVFIFVYPLPYFIAEVFHLAGFSLAAAIKLTFILAYLTSTIGIYFLAFNLWQSRLSGFIAAVLWSWAPPIFQKVFIGAALGEVVAFAFIPFTFLALHKLIHQPNLKHVFWLSLVATGWSLSHLLNPIIFSPLLIIFTLFELSQVKPKFLSLKYLLLSGLIVMGFSAWFIIPVVMEVRFTHFSDFVLSQYADQFVSFFRLLYSKWGTDAPGWGNNPVSQQVGLAQWLGIGLALIFFRRQVSPFIISFALSIFLMLPISKFIWDLPTPLQSVSTPWRFLSLAVFSSAVAAGATIKLIKNNLWRMAVILSLIILALYGNRHHLRINEIRDYDLNFFQNYTGVATGWNEHLPIWVKSTPDKFPLTKLEVISGDCKVQSQTLKSNFQQFTVNCDETSKLQLNTTYFPGWRVKLNQQNINSAIQSNLEVSNGMMQFDIPAGSHQLTAEFFDTPLRRLSKIISCLTLLVVIVYYAFHRFNHVTDIFLAHVRIKR